MVKIAYRITAVPERKEHAERQRAFLGDAEIFMDEKHNGNIWNKFRVYESLIDSGYSHVCMSDDDVVYAKRFKEISGICAKLFPNSIFSFYHSRIKSGRTAYIDLVNCNVIGVCTIIPVRYLEGFLSFYEQELKGFKWDDTALKMYALMEGIQVFTTIPKIVDVDPMPATVRRKTDIQPNNPGFDFNARVDSFLEARVSFADYGMFNTHLPDGHPLNRRLSCALSKKKVML